MKCIRYIIVFILLSTAFSLRAVELQVSVDRDPIMEHESFTLTITAEGKVNQVQVDQKPLFQDFIVGSTSTESSYSLTQSGSQQVTRWNIRLTPKHKGRLTIPALQVGQWVTTPIHVQVVEASAQSQQGKNFLFYTELSDHAPYIFQTVYYSTRLLIKEGTNLEQGGIREPQGDHVYIELVEQENNRSDIIQGERYRVITRKYAVTPTRSGPLTLQSALFQGVYYDDESSQGFFRYRATPKEITLTSDANQLEVKAQPKDFPGPWFVSRHVDLDVQWQPNRQVIPLGEPITVTYTLTAEGSMIDQLPELMIQWPTDFRVYPEKPEKESFVLQGHKVAQMKQTFVLIPSEAGDYSLPEYRIPWFHTETQQIEYASLPAQQLHVIAAPGAQPQAYEQLSTAPESTQFSQDNEQQTALQPELNEVGSREQHGAQDWKTILIAFLLLSQLMTLALYIKQRKKAKALSLHKTPSAIGSTVGGSTLNALKHACLQQNAVQAFALYNQWLDELNRAIKNNPSALKEQQLITALYQHAELQQQLERLQASLYGVSKAPWQDGKECWETISHCIQKNSTLTPQKEVASLYK